MYKVYFVESKTEHSYENVSELLDSICHYMLLYGLSARFIVSEEKTIFDSNRMYH